jgi:virulence-associated protein VapD
MYAIAFDLEQETLKRIYPGQHHQNAYDDICRVLGKHGFSRQQGSVYFGRQGTTPVHCVLAVQDVSAKYAWFRFVVKDIRMLRIEENNDLLPAIKGQGDLPLGAADSAA